MKRTLHYLRPYRGTVITALIIKFTASVAELFLPLLLEYIVDDAVKTGKVWAVLVPGGVMFLCALVALVGNICANRLSVKASGEMTHDLRYDLFSKTCYLKCGQVDEYTVPSLISRLTSDTYYVNQMVARTMRIGVRAPILVIGGVILTFTLEPVLACILLATIPIVGVALWLITRKSIPLYAEVQRSGDDMVRSMQENATGIRVIKALSKTDYEVEKFGGVADRLAKTEYRANKVMSISNPFAALIFNLGLVAVIALGARRGNDGGVILAFLSYFTIILNGMNGLSKIFVVISRGAASADRLERVMATDCTEAVGEYPAGDGRNVIEFKDVCFSYNGVGNNLKDVNFAISRGQTLGIIGATGSGKTTVINLMMRLYDVDGGQVLVDGRDVRSYPADELRKKFGVAFQSDFLMSSSVRENVDYGRNLPEDAIEEAIDGARAREFVDGLEGGISFDLAQKASNLSGGQKQRLLIARALAARPEILVLDDSSSALDYATDAELRRALARDYAEVTKVIVAQRISSVKSADLILVLDDGEVLGAGTHDTLMQECAEYALIYAAQMGEEVATEAGYGRAQD